MLKTTLPLRYPVAHRTTRLWVGPIWSELLLALIPLALYLFLFSRLPDLLATHFDKNMRADGYWNKDAWYTLPLISLYSLIFLKLLRIIIMCLLFPKKKGAISDERSVNFIEIISKIMTYIEFSLLLMALSVNFGLFACNITGNFQSLNYIDKFIFANINILLMLIGNLCPKVLPNLWIGARTPYAYSSNDAWIKSQRFGSKIFTAVGFINLVAILSPLLNSIQSLALFNTGTLLLGALILAFWHPGRKKSSSQGTNSPAPPDRP